jgi:hypothetical protein
MSFTGIHVKSYIAIATYVQHRCVIVLHVQQEEL